MAVLAVPAVLLYFGESPSVGWGLDPPLSVLPVAIGVLLIVAGLAVMYGTIRLFSAVGEGTLAPWDPPRRLVLRGPYRHVRNPMIVGVLTVLFGEAALLGSGAVAIWALVFFAVNAVNFPLVEEPQLERRFGDDYATYKRHVPRWIPRLRPWTPELHD
jgi:protein-S-isoprenylcysteine O-methyltransferase Ste14